jgi:hypothetical protein
MYNLTVDEAYTFFVGDGEWLVHNLCDTLVLETAEDGSVFAYGRDDVTGETVGLGLGQVNQDGFVELAIYVKSHSSKTNIKGGEVFKALLEALKSNNPNIQGIMGIWRDGDNLATFNQRIGAGLSLSAAALVTFMGKMAQRAGFGNADVHPLKMNPDGTFASVNVYFTP